MRPFRQLGLDRRTLLRGGVAALALPWLDAMQPAGAPPPPAPKRCLFVFSPNGMNMTEWRPAGDGRAAKLGNTLESLAPFRDRLTVFSGLTIDGGFGHGDGPGDHARAGGSFLTCAHPRKTGGADIEAGVSIDQVIAARVGSQTTFASLELGMEKGAAAGICDSGYSCAYSNNISWRTKNTPVAKETDPKAVFARLFGDPDQAANAAAARQQRAEERSVLDAVLAEAKALGGKLAANDKQKLDQYLQSVRELEQRLQRIDGESATKVAVPKGLVASQQGYAEKLALMYELIALAFATDRTRVVTLMLGNAGSNRSYKFLDVPDGHHDLSHHGKKPEKLAAVAKINRFQIEQFAKFVERLRSEKTDGGDLLSQSLVMLGSGISDGDRHNHDDLPVLVVGDGGGAAKGRGHVKLPPKTPMANLYLAMQRAMGVEGSAFADSTEALDLK